MYTLTMKGIRFQTDCQQSTKSMASKTPIATLSNFETRLGTFDCAFGINTNFLPCIIH